MVRVTPGSGRARSIAEIASREAKFAAAEAFFEKYGVPPLDVEAIERIEAEWRGETPKKRRRRAA
jgi:hypothetical protein